MSQFFTPAFAFILLSILSIPSVQAETCQKTDTCLETGALIDELTQDMNKDNIAETLQLRKSDHGASLILKTETQTLTFTDIVFSGIAGQQPSLEALENGSVRLKSQNSAIGRSRWSQTLTLVYRQQAYRIGGFTWQEYDTLQQYPALFCDLNLLSGKGIVRHGNGKTQKVATDLKAPKLEDWTMALFPDACKPLSTSQ